MKQSSKDVTVSVANYDRRQYGGAKTEANGTCWRFIARYRRTDQSWTQSRAVSNTPTKATDVEGENVKLMLLVELKRSDCVSALVPGSARLTHVRQTTS